MSEKRCPSPRWDPEFESHSLHRRVRCEPDFLSLAPPRGIVRVCRPAFLYQTPLAHGADLVVTSLTKYVGGHSDLIAGGCSGEAAILEPIRGMRTILGAMCDPHTGWLLMRSLETLKLRVTPRRKGCESSSEERSAGNLHATFCGNRGRATASGDPVGYAFETARSTTPAIPLPRQRPVSLHSNCARCVGSTDAAGFTALT
jgi:Cys/Met metabolism PLP-dependent enzyme